jgi:hypothetical protein
MEINVTTVVVIIWSQITVEIINRIHFEPPCSEDQWKINQSLEQLQTNLGILKMGIRRAGRRDFNSTIDPFATLDRLP